MAVARFVPTRKPEPIRAALGVPSVIMPRSSRNDPGNLNYLINPAHPEFAAVLEIGELLPLEFDFRL